MVFLFISKQGGTGGPLINCNGEVIGINFYEHSYTSFLPINIASRCLECLEKNGYVHLFFSQNEKQQKYAFVVSDFLETQVVLCF